MLRRKLCCTALQVLPSICSCGAAISIAMGVMPTAIQIAPQYTGRQLQNACPGNLQRDYCTMRETALGRRMHVCRLCVRSGLAARHVANNGLGERPREHPSRLLKTNTYIDSGHVYLADTKNLCKHRAASGLQFHDTFPNGEIIPVKPAISRDYNCMPKPSANGAINILPISILKMSLF